MAIESLTVDELLAAIARRAPTPGGGAVAAVTAALGVALGRMVVAFSEGRTKLAEHAGLHEEAAAALDAARPRLLALAEADAEAYARVNELWKLPEDDTRRRAEMPAAVQAAIDVPDRIAAESLDVLALLERLGGRTNRMLASDLAIAAILAEAAVRAAVWNVRINLPLLGDESRRSGCAQRIRAQVEEAARRARAIEAGAG